MTKKQARDYIQNNREVLTELSREIEECRKVDSTEYQYDAEAKKAAIEIVSRFMEKVFGAAYDEEMYPKPEEDNLFIRLNEHKSQ